MPNKPKQCAHEGCKSPPSLIRPNGFCWSHGPKAKERLSKAGRRGGETMRRRLQRKSIPAEDLPALVDHESAKRWLETVGRAVASGALDSTQGRTCIVAVEAWLKAHVGEAEMKLFEELRADVEKLKGTLRVA